MGAALAYLSLGDNPDEVEVCTAFACISVTNSVGILGILASRYR